jgi:hypothetical protein
MTKTRTPGSLEAIMLDVIRILGAQEAAKAAGVHPKTLRDYSDPDRAGSITFDRAIALDKACMAKLGCAPFANAFKAALEQKEAA